MATTVVINAKKSTPGSRSFRSSVTHHETRGSQAYLPKPIMERFQYPRSVVFKMQGDVVIMSRG